MDPDAFKIKNKAKLFSFESLCSNLSNDNFVRHDYVTLKPDRVICHLIFKYDNQFYLWEYARSLFGNQDIIFENNTILCIEMKRADSIRYDPIYIKGKNEISMESIEKMLDREDEV